MSAARAPFLGRGPAFPVRLDRAGGLQVADGADKIEQSIRLVIGTAYGDRPMRPEFGCAIHDHVFAPVDATTAGIIAYEVRASLERWEPRIEVTSVDVLVDRDVPECVYIDLSYRVVATNSPRNLVFPFYTIPQEG